MKLPHEFLSDREYEVFLRLASGCDPSALGHQLGISVKTVHTYKSRIQEKLVLVSNVDMAHYALRHELIENKYA